jgi:uncharacterized membrane protein YagU involved in acid resistance
MQATEQEGAGLRRQRRHRTNPWTFSANVGFFAGLFWGLIKLFFYAFEFTKVEPAFFAKTWYVSGYLITRQGYVVSMFWIIVGSIASALLYAALFRKLKGPWPGVIYGLVWWAALFLWIGPATGMTEPIWEMDRNSFWTELCLFVLWGEFIGFSINFEFTDEQSRNSDPHMLK